MNVFSYLLPLSFILSIVVSRILYKRMMINLSGIVILIVVGGIIGPHRNRNCVYSKRKGLRGYAGMGALLQRR
jgi:hypothetical protein